MSSYIAMPGQISFGGFGKLPGFAEFIRVGADGHAPRALERWVQSGMHYSLHEDTSGWEMAYDARLYHRFVFRPDGCCDTLVGVIRASSDAHARRFPFVGFASVPTPLMDEQPLLMVRLNDALYPELEQRAINAAGASSVADIRTQFTSPWYPTVEFCVQEARYLNFLEEVSCGELGLAGLVAGDVLLNELIQVLTASRGIPRTWYGAVQLPLFTSQYVQGLALRFWIELCLLLLQWYPPTLSLFWPGGLRKVADPSLLVAFREPDAGLFGVILRATGTGKGRWRPGIEPGPPGSSSGYLQQTQSSWSLRRLLTSINPGYPNDCPWNR